MDDITRFGCQHITGKDAEGFLTFCEAAVKPGSSYCAEHHVGKRVSKAEYAPERYEIDWSRDGSATRYIRNPW
jgi:hypothetical protein